MARKSTIGHNPLDAVIPRRAAAKTAAAPATKQAKAGPAAEKPATEKEPTKVRATFLLPPDVTERARRAVFWTPGETMAALAERAIAAEVDRMEKKQGKSFAPVPGRIKTGRPVGS